MKKQILFLCCILLLAWVVSFQVFAQQSTITGKVVDDTDNSPVAGAFIKLKNGKGAAVADHNGVFSLKVNPSQNIIIEVSSVGYAMQEVTVNGSSIDIRLQRKSSVIEDVVVTALGIKKEKKRLGYAVQEIKGEDLVKAREPNAIATLTGKVAGLRIANSSDFFKTPDIKLRGVTPLIVVDGMPLESSNMWEISGDDIESYSVLKGPAASALYGSRGVNGAIQITTKRGSSTKRRSMFEFNSTTTFDVGMIAQPKIQYDYGTGYHGAYKQGDGTDEYWGAWGPKLDGRLLVQYNSPLNPDGTKQPMPWIARGKDNLQNFLRTGILNTDNVSFSTSNENSDFRVSLSQMFQRGVVPNTKLGGTTFNISGGAYLGSAKKLRFDATVNYNKLYTPNYPSVGYGRSSFIYGMILWVGANTDVRDLRNYWVPGQEGLQQYNYDGAGDYNNPYFVAYEQTNGYYRDAINGKLSLQYKLNDHLSITARTAVNNYTQYEPKVWPKSFNWVRDGAYSENWYNMFESNTDVLAEYNGKISTIDLKATVGGSFRSWQERNIYGTTDGLYIPEFNNFSNSINPKTPTNYKRDLEEYGIYGSVDLSYKSYVFLGLTGRYDKSSTLPLNNNGYFYPSVSLSTVLNEYIRFPQAISFVKLRGAVTKVGGAMSPYQTSVAYTTGTRWDDNLTLFYPDGLISNDIGPSFSTGSEVGGEIRFLNSRLGLDVTYFNFVDGPQTYNQAISSASGYATVLVSGRKTQRKGWELQLIATPVQKNDFRWNIALNWSTYKQYLKELAPGEKNEGILRIGDRMDYISGYGFEFSPDGQVVIGSNGLPVYQRNKKLGYYGDNWIGGITNTFSYKQLVLSFSFDARVGGKIISQYERYLWAGGRHVNIDPKERERWYNSTTDDYVVQGVKVISGEISRDVNGKVISDTRQFAPNDYKTNYFDYIQNTYGYWGLDEAAIVNRGYVKLREVVLTYKFPQHILDKSFIKGASISVVGRNLLLFTNSSIIDPDQFTGAYDNLQTPAFRNIGFNINVNF